MKLHTGFKALATLALAILPLAASAAYPDRPIRMIIAYSAGGGTDVVARAMAPFIEKHLGGGAKIIVENKTGAGGAIGFAAIAAAPRRHPGRRATRCASR